MSNRHTLETVRCIAPTTNAAEHNNSTSAKLVHDNLFYFIPVPFRSPPMDRLEIKEGSREIVRSLNKQWAEAGAGR